ncbi:hypothetical protein [uncultured Methylobacterium sp.]|jgi:hypothetical protein|uniref:hypothetical protein n=1 Tax=uncultured Methylobacterium sp. TaxID=157278 RepID=UPI00262BA1CE|nr:hypothetical protein [uncultured Methylobacterium sp.]
MKSDQWVLIDVLPDGTIAPHSRHDYARILKRVERVAPDRGGKRMVRASLAQVRSLPQLRLYWPWIRKVIENSPINLSEKLLHGMLLVACGYSEPFMTIEGDIQMMPSSIAFESMKQEEFDDYFERAQKIVSEKILPGVNLKSLMNEAKNECRWEQEAA